MARRRKKKATGKQAALQRCVDEKISIVSREDKEKTQQQILGKTFGICRREVGLAVRGPQRRR